MAEQDLADRTERATPKRIDEARKRGQVPRSVELGAAAVTLAGGAGLYVLGASMSEGMATMLRKGLSLNPVSQLQDSDMMAALSSASRDALWSVAPLLGLLLAAALLSPLVIGGWNFSTGAMGFKFERLNPLNGFKRMFSARGWIELGKSLAKFSVVALIAVLVLWNRADELTSLGAQPIELAHRARCLPVCRGPAGAGGWPGADRAGRCAVAAVAVPPRPAHDTQRNPRRKPRRRRIPRGQQSRAQRAAGHCAPSHDAGSAEGECCHHQPAALRGRPAGTTSGA